VETLSILLGPVNIDSVQGVAMPIPINGLKELYQNSSMTNTIMSSLPYPNNYGVWLKKITI